MERRLSGSLSRENSASGGGSSVLQSSGTEPVLQSSGCCAEHHGEMRHNVDNSNILLLEEIMKVRCCDISGVLQNAVGFTYMAQAYCSGVLTG